MSDTITIVGTIGTDPERKTPNGLPITTFRVASPQRRFDRATGAWIDTGTNWYTVSAYRGLAEHAFESLRKKDRVILTGRLKVRNWDTGESKGTAVEVDVDAIGHDLLFGTSVFTRDSPAAASSIAARWRRVGTRRGRCCRRRHGVDERGNGWRRRGWPVAGRGRERFREAVTPAARPRRRGDPVLRAARRVLGVVRRRL